MWQKVGLGALILGILVHKMRKDADSAAKVSKSFDELTASLPSLKDSVLIQ